MSSGLEKDLGALEAALGAEPQLLSDCYVKGSCVAGEGTPAPCVKQNSDGSRAL